MAFRPSFHRSVRNFSTRVSNSSAFVSRPTAASPLHNKVSAAVPRASAVKQTPQAAPLARPSARAFSSPAPSGAPKMFHPQWRIHKGKAALGLKPMRANLTEGEKGFYLQRAGGLMLEFANVVNDSAPTTGDRQYDWPNKQLFLMNVTEAGTLAAWDGAKPLVFVHDPNIANAEEKGAVKKTLQISKADSKDGKGTTFFFSLSVARGEQTTKIPVPLTPGEFAAIRELNRASIPYYLGWMEGLAPIIVDAEHPRGNRGSRGGAKSASQPAAAKTEAVEDLQE